MSKSQLPFRSRVPRPRISVFGSPTLLVLLALVVTVVFPGCDLAEGILKVGFWGGVIVVLIIVGVIWFAVRSVRGRGPRS